MKVNKGWVLRLAVAGFVLSGWRAAAAEYSWVGGGADTFWRTAESSQAVVCLLLGVGCAERAVRAGALRNHSVHPVRDGGVKRMAAGCQKIQGDEYAKE